MSKAISFGFGKPKAAVANHAHSTKSNSGNQASRSSTARGPRGALRGDSDDDDDEGPPQSQALTGFSSAGAILSKPQTNVKEKVILSGGNGDWRKRGRTNLLPAEVQAAQREAIENGHETTTVERVEISKASGLQFAKPTANGVGEESRAPATQNEDKTEAPRMLTEDERALQALLDDGTGRPKSDAVVANAGNVNVMRVNETDDFRSDVAMRPESATLEDYAAMPVEEFGMAMLRGMGQKRKANGETINFDQDKVEERSKRQKKNEGFLGIGAKQAKGLDGVELGAWGKADMRKNNRGEGFFTPVMRIDQRTGEKMTEEEFEKRRHEAGRSKKGGDDDWQKRRDKESGRNGRDVEESESSRKRVRQDPEYDSRSSRREKGDGESSYRSQRRRSRSKDRQHDRDGDDESRRRRDKMRHRDRYDDAQYTSRTTSRNGHRERDRSYDRDDRKRRDRR